MKVTSHKTLNSLKFSKQNPEINLKCEIFFVADESDDGVQIWRRAEQNMGSLIGNLFLFFFSFSKTFNWELIRLS